LLFFRPAPDARFEHIDTLFSASIDWALIERYWDDLMQVILSIAAGKVSSAMLLRKLGNASEKNKLFLVAQEVGRVIRTAYLLEWINNSQLRREVTATTNIIESYNAFAKWLCFGGEGVMAENDPDEKQKRLRYNDLVASAVILDNVVDMTRILNDLKTEGVERRYRANERDAPECAPDNCSTSAITTRTQSTHTAYRTLSCERMSHSGRSSARVWLASRRHLRDRAPRSWLATSRPA
jgi:TnpA family transposase